jgi:hypothetical protein
MGSDGAECITAEELAGAIGTVNYEITTRIASRVPRVYLNESPVSQAVTADSQEKSAR